MKQNIDVVKTKASIYNIVNTLIILSHCIVKTQFNTTLSRNKQAFGAFRK